MVPMLEAHMQLLSKMMAVPRPNERILTLLLQYMQYSITHGPAFKVIRAHVKPMLFNAALPLMYFSADDKELFVTDPHEFVRKVRAESFNLKCLFVFVNVMQSVKQNNPETGPSQVEVFGTTTPSALA